MFTFLSPLFLIGLSAAAIPLIIHLSRSKRTKKMRFSTTRFFTDQFLRSYRMSRLKELLLLACRMALFALLATALARPLVMPQGGTSLGAGARAVVLVLDNSASMGYLEDGRTLLDRAKDAGRQLVDGLRPGDTASVVLAGRRAAGPEVLFPELTPDLGDVRRAVDGVSVAALGTDLRRAVERAEQIVLAGTAPNKEVYVLSDLQDAGWEIVDDATARAETGVEYSFVRVRPKTVENVAVTALQYAPARPIAGVPLAIRPHLLVQGLQGRPCVVRLFVYNKDGKSEKVGERQIDQLRPGRGPAPRFYHTFTVGGWQAGYVELQDDALTLDNRRYFAFQVLDAAKILAVNGAPSQDPAQDELFFLRAALTANPEGKNPLQVDPVAPAALEATDLTKYAVVILANVATLSPGAVEKLEAYVDRGGSLLIFLGDQVNSTFYNQSLAGSGRPHGGLLPGTLKTVEGKPNGADQFTFVADVADEHSALAAFQDAKFANLAGVTFKAFWGIEPGEASVLMRASTGAPLLCEKPFGKGRVMLFAATCDRDWTNFPMRPAYLPWLHGLIGYLAQEPLAREAVHVTGDPVPLPFSALDGVQQIKIKKPDGTAGLPVLPQAGGPLVFADTEQPGIYRFAASEKDEAPALVAVNLERFESDLTGLDDVLAEQASEVEYPTREAKIAAEFRKLLGRAADDPRIAYVDDPARLNDLGPTGRQGWKLWDYLLWVVLVLALLEPWLANRTSLRHYGQVREVSVSSPRVPG